MTYLQVAIAAMCTPVLTAIRNGADSETVSAILEAKIAEHTGTIPASELRLYALEHIRNMLSL